MSFLDDMPEEGPILPSVEELITRIPLYEQLTLDKEARSNLIWLESSQYTINIFCINCGRESVFEHERDSSLYRNLDSMNNIIFFGDRYIKLVFSCARNKEHRIILNLKMDQGTLTKIGQYPSIADLHSADIAKYRPVLGRKYAEFTKAIGLASHGIGIGAFVYLRRIFEDLIEQAHQQAQGDDAWDDDAFGRSRMSEKIELLHNHLPDFLVENKGLYSILSKGIHELDENECREYFEPVRVGIELILDEQLERQNRRAKTAQAKKVLSDIATKIGQRNNK